MKGRIVRFGILIVLLYASFVIFNDLRTSLFFKTEGRYTLLIYDRFPYVLSMDFSKKYHTLIILQHNVEEKIPGGYGKYRIGALGKLAYLENDFTLVNRAVSSLIMAPIQGSIIAFHPELYHDDNSDLISFNLNFRHLFLMNYKSNISFFNRLFILMESYKIENVPDRYEIIYDVNGLVGRLYDETFRSENRTVQLIYNNYSSANELANIFNGYGIQVVDISKSLTTQRERCYIVEEGSYHSRTAEFIGAYLGCKLGFGETDISDIIVSLDEQIEKNWAM